MTSSWLSTLVGVFGFRSLRAVARPTRPVSHLMVAGWRQDLSMPPTPLALRHHSLFLGDDNDGSVRSRWGVTEANFQSTRNVSHMPRGGENSQTNDNNAEGVPMRSTPRYPVSTCTTQGPRSKMEDEHYVSLDHRFAAVFDGHGGKSVSKYLRKNLFAKVQAALPVTTTHLETDDSTKTTMGTAAKFNQMALDTPPSSQDKPSNPRRSQAPTIEEYQNALESAIKAVDQEVQKIAHWSYQGSTAVAVWVHEERPENGCRTIIAANVGDSRAVLCRNNTGWDLTKDHKPKDPDEQIRIEGLGGKVVWCGETDEEGDPIQEMGVYRVNGDLALSRAIGDRADRPFVSGEPDVIAVPVEPNDEFILIATDGLWDVLASSEAVEFVQQFVQDGIPKDEVATRLVEIALSRGTWDNVTVVIIWL